MISRAPDTDVVDILLRQHARIRDLFLEVQGSTGQTRRDAFGELVRLLAVHETAEEEIVHPLARQSLPGGDQIVADRLAEEHDANELLARLEDTDPDDPAFLPSLGQLREAVLVHARKEERYEFFRLRAEFTPAQRAALAAAVAAAQATAPTSPHPGVESATANLLVGPALAVMDRTRDLIRAALGDSRS